MSTSKFLGLDDPINKDAKLDAEDVSFTIEFETPIALRMIDASHDAFTLQEPSLMAGSAIIQAESASEGMGPAPGGTSAIGSER